jgi:hydrogenase maturation protease
MNRSLVDQVVSAVLYEGYVLYPYRPSLKNRQRWTFGGLFPRAYSEAHGGTDAWTMQSECLVHGTSDTRLDIKVGFLHLVDRRIGQLASPLPDPPAEEPKFQVVPSLQVGDVLYHTWQEAVERAVVPGECSVQDLLTRRHKQQFSFPSRHQWEPLQGPDRTTVGILQRKQERVDGSIEISGVEVGDGLFRITVRIMNHSSLEHAVQAERDEALLRSSASTHTVLNTKHGEFVSLIDPPEPWRAAAAECRNVGAWPVLVGEEGQMDTMLSAPIILYDYPQIAPESPGDLFDSTEIDELLTLRIQTLTDHEKHAMAAVDQQTRTLLERSERLAREELLGLHGVVRGLRPIEKDEE